MLASIDDSIYISLESEIEVDIDEEYDIKQIETIVFDVEDRIFYLLANKYKDYIGFILLKVSEDDPYHAKFLMNHCDKLDVGDANIYISKDPVDNSKELIISYKSIYLNILNTVIFSLSASDEVDIIFWHESFQLWETRVMGFILHKNLDFVQLSSRGMNIIGLGSIDKRAFKNNHDKEIVLHPLEQY